MRSHALGLGLVLLALTSARAQNALPEGWKAVESNDQIKLLNATIIREAPEPEKKAPPEKMPDPVKKPDPMKAPEPAKLSDLNTPPAQGDQFAGATEAGTQPGAMHNPAMFGDLIGVMGQRRFAVGQPIIIPGTNNSPTQVVQPTQVVRGIPMPGRYNGFKVSDNDSPRPQNRIYFGYNYFSDVGRSTLPAAIPSLQMNQQMGGFERTFLGGDASFGMRLPFIQLNGFSQAESQVIGDLSLRAKFAWINDPQTGNVFSTGMIVTVPTGSGENIILADDRPATHSTLYQPWAGFIYNLPNLYFQGFSSLVVPSDGRDPMIFFNSISAGYWLYRNPLGEYLTGFVPTVELHANTPLNHRTPNETIYFQDQFNVTTGAYFMFSRLTIGGAVCVPLMGPKPYDVEGILNLSLRF